jgi:hypothetical protein
MTSITHTKRSGIITEIKMIKIWLLLPLAIISCSVNANYDKQNSYTKNAQVEHTVGHEGTKGKTIKFTLNSTSNDTTTILINVDKLPFKEHFDLCEITGHYKYSVHKDTLDYDFSAADTDTEKVNCDSFVEISQLDNGKYALSYELNLLMGYDVQRFKGFDIYKPYTQRTSHFSHEEGKSYSHTRKYTDSVLSESVSVEVNL